MHSGARGKKLTAAGRAWALGRAPGAGPVMDTAEVLADMAFFGADDAAIAAVAARQAQDEGPGEGPGKNNGAVEIHSDNGAAFRLFTALGSQWRLCAFDKMLMRTGIDYGAVEMVARVMRIDLDAENFARLRALEVAALEAWADERRAAR